jgi:hypothetical protein
MQKKKKIKKKQTSNRANEFKKKRRKWRNSKNDAVLILILISDWLINLLFSLIWLVVQSFSQPIFKLESEHRAIQKWHHVRGRTIIYFPLAEMEYFFLCISTDNSTHTHTSLAYRKIKIFNGNLEQIIITRFD